ncbi:MAG TPA: hypothetical protein VGS10_04715 [Terracidiphilus sp.]|nr:hypothetical protein [Terracidiphilus sp.]
MSSFLSMRNALLLGVVFLLVCFSLGYPILNRYDPGKVPGTSDAADYCEMVRDPLSIASYRPFVPALAKPFYWMAKGRSGSWDPALFGMLSATSILTAATAVLIVSIGLRCGLTYSVSLLGAMLFLLNFAVANWNLSAYVDSGEALFLALTTWSLLAGRWYLLPLWAIPGSLSKETFAPFAVAFAFVWWLTGKPRRPFNLVWIFLLALLSGAAVLLSFSSGGFFAGSLHYTAAMARYSGVGFFQSTLRCLTAREFWYTFVWLLPLGVWRLRRFDRPWLWAAAITFILALLMGGYNNALGNTTRAFFNISGPLLSLSAAVLLTELGGETAGLGLHLEESDFRAEYEEPASVGEPE